MKSKSYVMTPAMGKRLIAKGIAALPEIRAAISGHRVLIVAGTTNAYVAQELLALIGDADGFDPRGFYRGITLGKGAKADAHPFLGDVLIEDGKWIRGADVTRDAATLKKGDVLLKGANAVYLPKKQAGVLIGHPAGGTVIPVISAAIGRRVTLLVPTGLEKRVDTEITTLAAVANAPEVEGPRLCPLPGRVFTELDAINILTGVEARLLAGGGVLGAEGCVYVLASGKDEQIDALDAAMQQLEWAPAMQL